MEKQLGSIHNDWWLSVRVGDLISFKPKSFGEDDWSNPCIVLDAYINDDRQAGGWKDTLRS